MTNARFNATKKMITLVEVLEACGVDSSIIDITTADNYVGIRINAWNCVDGSKVPITFVLMEDDDYTEMQVIAEPENEVAELFKKLLP